jgi:hypothetical protein
MLQSELGQESLEIIDEYKSVIAHGINAVPRRLCVLSLEECVPPLLGGQEAEHSGRSRALLAGD